MNEDGTTKVTLRPIALLKTPMELTESIAVDQAGDHLVTLLQTQEVGIRVTDGAEAMIGAVRRLFCDGDHKIYSQTRGDLECVWLN